MLSCAATMSMTVASAPSRGMLVLTAAPGAKVAATQHYQRHGGKQRTAQMDDERAFQNAEPLTKYAGHGGL